MDSNRWSLSICSFLYLSSGIKIIDSCADSCQNPCFIWCSIPSELMELLSCFLYLSSGIKSDIAIRSVIIEICANSCLSSLLMELMLLLWVSSDWTVGVGGEGGAVSVKVKGATFDVRNESEGNAVRGIFVVDPLLLSLSVTSD